jgi:hypothetical protein
VKIGSGGVDGRHHRVWKMVMSKGKCSMDVPGSVRPGTAIGVGYDHEYFAG